MRVSSLLGRNASCCDYKRLSPDLQVLHFTVERGKYKQKFHFPARGVWSFCPSCCKLAEPTRWHRVGYDTFHGPQQQIGFPVADGRLAIDPIPIDGAALPFVPVGHRQE